MIPTVCFLRRTERQVEMSEDDPNNGAELVPVEHGLALTSLADNRIVSQMVADSLVLARDSAPARVDLDALVREAKRLFRSKGDGMTEENIRAFKLFFRAAEAGHSEAQFHVGWCYHDGDGVQQDYVEAVKWYLKAAEQGYADAQVNLGHCYEKGEGVPQDCAESAKWYRKAADQGHAMAQNNLGICYRKGQGVSQDHVEAVKWYRKAAEQGYADAQTHLGYCYSNGQGVPQDYVEAVRWYRKAAERGYAYAQTHLGYCYSNGQGVPQDYVEAVKWYRKAAEQGYANAQAHLGYCYRWGQGVPQDYVEAVKWFRKAAEQNFAEAQYNLGNSYANGQGVAKDYTEAVKWYRKAAEQNIAPAQYNLGWCYVNGLGVAKDDVEGYKWFLLAGAQGDENAKKNIAAIESRLTREQIAEGQRLASNFKPREGYHPPGMTFQARLIAQTRPESSGTGFGLDIGPEPADWAETAEVEEEPTISDEQNDRTAKQVAELNEITNKIKENRPENHNGMSPDEWAHTVELIVALEQLDIWLGGGAAEVVEEEYLRSAEQKIAKASECIATKNAEYFQNKPSLLECQTVYRIDEPFKEYENGPSRDWNRTLKAGTKAAFPELDIVELFKIGGAFDLRRNLESLLILAYLRHAFRNRKLFLQDQDTGHEKEERAAGDDIYDVIIIGGGAAVGGSAAALFEAITSAAKGLKTLLIDGGPRYG